MKAMSSADVLTAEDIVDAWKKIEARAPYLVKITCHPKGMRELRKAFPQPYTGPQPLHSVPIVTDWDHHEDYFSMHMSDGSIKPIKVR